MAKIYIMNGRIIKEENLLKLKEDDGYSRNIQICEVIEEESIDLNTFLEQHRVQHERLEQLKMILEAAEYQDIINFTNAYREHVSDCGTKTTHLAEFKKIGLDNVRFKRYLQQKRRYFILEASSNIDYLKAYLKINRAKLDFTDYIYSDYSYRMVKPTISDEIRNNFNLAKEELYPEKKNKKAK